MDKEELRVTLRLSLEMYGREADSVVTLCSAIASKCDITEEQVLDALIAIAKAWSR